VSERPDHVNELVANFEKVFFDTDSSELDISSRKVLDRNAEILQEHRDVKVQVQGHADERGTVDYNLQLGNERANAVKDYLVNQGVGSDRITVISFGEEMPASTGHAESSWAQNRRAEFVVQWGG
jgi:peptidoglycan-associated lipoprotein